MEVESRRDRYSYIQLEPYMQELGKRAGDLQKEIQAKMQIDPDYKISGRGIRSARAGQEDHGVSGNGRQQ